MRQTVFQNRPPKKNMCIYIHVLFHKYIYIYYIFPPIHTMRVYRYINLERFCSHEAFKKPAHGFAEFGSYLYTHALKLHMFRKFGS